MSEFRNWVVWSNEHDAWWGPNHCGYYQSLLGAGLYTETEAKAIASHSSERDEEALALIDALQREAEHRRHTAGSIVADFVLETLADSKRLSQIEAWGLAYNAGSAWQDDLVKLERLNDPANEDDEGFVPEYEWSVHGPAHPGYPSGGVTIIGEGPTLRAAIDNAQQKEATKSARARGVA